MKISKKDWQNYIAKTRKVNEKAAAKVAEYMRTHDCSTPEGMKALVEYAHAVATKYGEGAAELSCQMIDEVAGASGKYIRAAEPAKTATYSEIAKTIYGTMATTKDPNAVGAAVGRTVKLASVDTLQQNALRDGAEWAWIPSGDTCAFCLMLASRGWVRASKKAIKNGHAEHIHNNCDCTYCVRYDGETTVEGYDPDALYEQYRNAGDTPRERLNAMRRQHYATNKDAINAQKRAAYMRKVAEQKGIKASTTKEKWIAGLTADERDKYREIIRRGTDPMRKGFSCFGDSAKDQLLKLGASRIQPKKGFFDIAMHGSPVAVGFGSDKANMGPRTLANIIKHHPDYNGENIRLLCCETGKTSEFINREYCFAEELANILGVTVEAPDDLVYIRTNGTWFVGTPNNTTLIPFTPNQRGRYK